MCAQGERDLMTPNDPLLICFPGMQVLEEVIVASRQAPDSAFSRLFGGGSRRVDSPPGSARSDLGSDGSVTPMAM
jgi:hypothetical protein